VIFKQKPVTMSGAPRSKAAPGAPPAASSIGPRFSHLALGRDLPKSATGKSPGSHGATAAKPAAAKPDSAELAHARTKAVFASEASQGRERLAAEMLDTRMGSAEIIELLATMPKVADSAANSMLQRLTSQQNPDLGPGFEGGNSRSDNGEFWSRVRAANGERS
jgi:hypothetical protein